MSVNAKFWSNVTIDVQTGLGSANTITGITKANPGVVTYSGTDPSANGDIYVFDIAGMTELHKRAFAVEGLNAAANSFTIENTVGNHTFTSGSCTPVTLGASMTNVQGVTASGGEPEFADITTVHDQIRRRVPTVVSPFSIQFDCIFDPDDAAMIELALASRTITTRVIKVTFADGSYMVGNAYVSAAGVPTGSAQDVVKTNVSLEFQGLPTVYGA
jgi:hypothetical protein